MNRLAVEHRLSDDKEYAMPMDFPDMKSLEDAAEVHKFRKPLVGESELDFRRELADHVQPIDFIESEEIRNGHGWDKWDEGENRAMLGRTFFSRSGHKV